MDVKGKLNIRKLNYKIYCTIVLILKKYKHEYQIHTSVYKRKKENFINIFVSYIMCIPYKIP